MSICQALQHATLALGVESEVVWLHSTDLENDKGWKDLESAHGIIVPGGFGSRGIEGKIAAARFARQNQVPYLGLCLGMQVMVIEFGRHVLGSESVNSTEFNHNTSHPVIDLLPEQGSITEMGGTMRLGLYPCKLVPGTIAAEAYNQELVQERHRHRYEFKNTYREIMGENGMIFSGLSPDDRLVEIVEFANHPFMVGCQFHPEFLSRPNKPHPLFRAFMESVVVRAQSTPQEKSEEFYTEKSG
jgi:CTP synthase